MLAPRKKLWSTPLEVIEMAVEVLLLDESDICYDIGAGDGRFLQFICEHTSSKITGIEIDQERCERWH